MRGKTSASKRVVAPVQRAAVTRTRRSRSFCSAGSPGTVAEKSLRSRPGLPGQRPELQPEEQRGVACWFGATCVGVLLERMRLHLGTQRFLAARRGDRMWEASCDYAALSLERLESRLRPGMYGAPLFPAARRRRLRTRRRATANPRTLSRNRKGCGTRHGHSTAVVARLFRGGASGARRSWKSPASEDAGYSKSSRPTAGRLRPAKQAARGGR